jgi:O-antigen/teichoic acid export membrane protein
MMRQLLRDSLIYLAPSLLARGIGLVLLPVYTRYLGPADYGVVEILAVTYALLNLVLPLEVAQAVARYSVEAGSAARKSLQFSTAFWFTALVFAAWLGLTLALPTGLARMIVGVEDDPLLLPAASTAMLANSLLYLALNQLRWNLQPVAYAIASTVFAVATAAVSLTLIVGLGFGVYGVIWAQFAGSALALLYAATALTKTSPLVLRCSRDELATLVTFSAPLVLSGIAIYLATYADRWMVSISTGMEGVGLYSVPSRLASVIALLTTSIQLALAPWIFNHYREQQAAASIRGVFQLYLLGAFSLIALIGSFAGEIIALISGPRFHEASVLVAPVLVASLVASLYVFAPGLAIEKRTGLLARANLAGAAVNIAANALLIPAVGLIGAAFGTLAGAIVMTTLKFTWSQRYYPIPYRWGRYALALGMLIAVLWLTWAGTWPASWRLALVAAAVAVFTLLLVSRDDRLLLSRLA